MNNIDIMNHWIDNANRDYDTMKTLFECKKYTWSLFVGHLVIEKLFKALYAKNNKGAPHAPRTHDLSYLASKIAIDLTEEQKDLLDIITRFNLDGRYDDYKNNFYILCNEEYTKNSIEKINTIRDWLLELLNDESEDKKDEQ